MPRWQTVAAALELVPYVALPSLTRVVAVPPVQPYVELEASRLGTLPPFTPLEPWTASHIFELLPSGNPGADCICVHRSDQMCEDGLFALVELFNAADEGGLPSFLTQARATLILKPHSTDR